jgi:hypothetical protein
VKTKKEFERQAKISLFFILINSLQFTLYLIALEKSTAFYILVPLFAVGIAMYAFFLGVEIAGIVFLENKDEIK